MAFYLKSSQIPELKPYTFTQRAQIIKLAQAHFTVPDKFILNIAKLVVLSPIFVMVAQFEAWWMLIPMLIVGLCYPLITNPIQLNLAKKYLAKALKNYQAQTAAELDEDEA